MDVLIGIGNEKGCRPVGAYTTFAPLEPTAVPWANDKAPVGAKNPARFKPQTGDIISIVRRAMWANDKAPLGLKTRHDSSPKGATSLA
jgi:hypothetical protein